MLHDRGARIRIGGGKSHERRKTRTHLAGIRRPPNLHRSVERVRSVNRGAVGLRGVGWTDERGVIPVGSNSWREGEVVRIPITPSPVQI